MKNIHIAHSNSTETHARERSLKVARAELKLIGQIDRLKQGQPVAQQNTSTRSPKDRNIEV
jgi:hypothetical protein